MMQFPIILNDIHAVPEKPCVRVHWDNAHNILRVNCTGDFSEKEARVLMNKINPYIQNTRTGLLVLNDLTCAGSSSLGARKIFLRMLQSPKLKKSAFLTKNVLTMVGMKLVINFSRVKNARLFTSEKSAIRWLKQT